GEAFHSHNDSLTADEKRSQGARGFSEGSPKENDDEGSEKRGTPPLVPGDQKSAEAQEDKADEPYRVSAGQQTIEPVDATFPWTGGICRRPGEAHQLAEARAHVPERIPAEVGNLEVIAQQIIAIELYQGIEIEQSFDSQGGGDDESEVIGQCGGIGEPPKEHGQRPTENFEPCARERHEEALAFFGK